MGASREGARRLGIAVFLTVAGVVLAVLFAIPALFLPLSPLELFVATMVLSELGFAVAAVAFVALAGVGIGYLRIRRLDRRAIAFVVGGTLGLFGFRIVGLVAVELLDLPVAGNAITEFPGVDVGTIVLVLIPISVLVIGPAEELLFRGAIQRTLEAGSLGGGRSSSPGSSSRWCTSPRRSWPIPTRSPSPRHWSSSSASR